MGFSLTLVSPLATLSEINLTNAKYNRGIIPANAILTKSFWRHYVHVIISNIF